MSEKLSSGEANRSAFLLTINGYVVSSHHIPKLPQRSMNFSGLVEKKKKLS